jgi:hypothetical protein
MADYLVRRRSQVRRLAVYTMRLQESQCRLMMGRLAEMKSRLSGVFAFDSTAGLAKCG